MTNQCNEYVFMYLPIASNLQMLSTELVKERNLVIILDNVHKLIILHKKYVMVTH